MDVQKNEFSKLESIKSNTATFIAMAFGAAVLVIAVFGIVYLELIIIESGKISVEVKILSAALGVILLSFLVYFILKDTMAIRKNKIIKVIVDQNGLHHFKDEKNVESLTFKSLYPNPDPQKYDVFVSDGEDVALDICVCYFDNSKNKIVYKTIILNTPFSIRNGKELKRHFIKGILQFRPDLKVSPGVLDLLHLKDS
jgi:succinate dehydrogenase hydrophobic anchor subunit